MYLIKRHQNKLINSGFQARFLVPIVFLLLVVSCDPASGPDFKRDKELRLQIKPVLLIENESISQKDIAAMINSSTIRKGGYVAIIPTSAIAEDQNANKLSDLFYNQKVEAVHILIFKPQSAIMNTDVLTIENATILCLLDGDTENFVGMAAYPVLKSAILNAYKKGTLLVMNGKACLLSDDPYFTFGEKTILGKID
ncbi:MAG: hypothetical protein A2W85_01780 [Bacteroidetes bacterium GWF2_41_31]|nr:MAG: hypothetical protein A2W85_01780 [Bacteroidetes bacterium GWF2_41_31]